MGYVLYPTTPATPLSVTSGAIGNISDNNSSTVCVVQGETSTVFFFTVDLGSSKKVRQVKLIQWYQTGGTDTGFEIMYSDSALNSGNQGTAYGSSFSSTGAAQDTTQTGNITARYWGLRRVGNFLPNTIGMGDFNLYFINNAAVLIDG